MPKRLLDRLTLFGRAWLDVTIPTGSVRPTQRRYAVNLLDMSDPPRFRDEAVVMLPELLSLGVRGHCMPSTIVPSCLRGPMMLACLISPQVLRGPVPRSLRISRRLTISTRTR